MRIVPDLLSISTPLEIFLGVLGGSTNCYRLAAIAIDDLAGGIAAQAQDLIFRFVQRRPTRNAVVRVALRKSDTPVSVGGDEFALGRAQRNAVRHSDLLRLGPTGLVARCANVARISSVQGDGSPPLDVRHVSRPRRSGDSRLAITWEGPAGRCTLSTLRNRAGRAAALRMKLGAQAQQAAEQKDLCFHRYVLFLLAPRQISESLSLGCNW